MKKTLITLAVAAAVAAPVASQAEAVLYGKFHVSIDYTDQNYVNDVLLPTDVDGDGVLNDFARVGYKGWGINGSGQSASPAVTGIGAYGIAYPTQASRANRFGIKGSEDLGNGLKAIYQMELGVNMGETNAGTGGADGLSLRNSFVGLAGGFGTFLVGRHDTPLKISTGKLDLFGDTMADYNGTIGFHDVRASGVIAYISPSFSGFQFAGAVVSTGGTTAGGAQNVNADSINEGWSVAGIYKNGPFYGSLAYESLGSELFMGTQNSERGNCNGFAGFPTLGTAADPVCNAGGYVGDDFNKWRIGLGILDWNGFTLTGIYEEQSDLPGSGTLLPTGFYSTTGQADFVAANNDKRKLWQIQAGYSFGNNMVKAMYGQMNRDGKYSYANANAYTPQQRRDVQDLVDGDRTSWAIAFDHNFSKRTKVYALYTDVSDDLKDIAYGAEWSGFSLGMVHSF